MGLAIDMGRLYFAKSESQTFVDLTALAAAKKLDGTAAHFHKPYATVPFFGRYAPAENCQ